MRFFCPSCWTDFAEDIRRCPHCGVDIKETWNSKDYVEKLICTLDHPIGMMRDCAARVLGQIGDPRAVNPLVAVVRNSADPYVVVTAVRALAKIGTTEAMAFLRTLVAHPSKQIRDLIAELFE